MVNVRKDLQTRVIKPVDSEVHPSQLYPSRFSMFGSMVKKEIHYFPMENGTETEAILRGDTENELTANDSMDDVVIRALI